MSAHRILYLTPNQMLVYQPSRQGFERLADFSPDTAEAFSTYLAQHANHRFTMVVNVADEGFQLERIPYLQGKDRQTLIQRKLNQAFHGAPLTLALSMGRETDRRRNEKLLLAALTNLSTFEPWIAALQKAGTRLTGIHSVAILGQILAQRMGFKGHTGALLTLQDLSLRQTYLIDGHVAFSRLTPLANSSLAGIAQQIHKELDRLQQYLVSQRLLSRNRELLAHILTDEDVQQALSHLPATQGLALKPLPLAQCAQKIGLKAPLADWHAEPIFMQLALWHAPLDQFAPAVLRLPYRIWQGRLAIQGLAMASLGACLLAAGNWWLEAQNIHQQRQESLAATQSADRAYQNIIASFLPLPMGNDTLRAIDQSLTRIQEGIRRPEAALQQLSRALELAPEIQLERVAWAHPLDERQTPQAEILRIEAHLQAPSGSSPKNTMLVFDRFRAALERSAEGADWEAIAIQQPYDIGTDQTLKSAQRETPSADEGSATRVIVLELRRREGRT